MSRPFRTPDDERDAFRAFANPLRRRMLAAMADRPLSFEQLGALIGRSDGSLGQHLRILREANLLTITRRGGRLTYQVRRQSLRCEAQWLAQLAAPTPTPRRRSA